MSFRSCLLVNRPSTFSLRPLLHFIFDFRLCRLLSLSLFLFIVCPRGRGASAPRRVTAPPAAPAPSSISLFYLFFSVITHVSDNKVLWFHSALGAAWRLLHDGGARESTSESNGSFDSLADSTFAPVHCPLNPDPLCTLFKIKIKKIYIYFSNTTRSKCERVVKWFSLAEARALPPAGPDSPCRSTAARASTGSCRQLLEVGAEPRGSARRFGPSAGFISSSSAEQRPVPNPSRPFRSHRSTRSAAVSRVPVPSE